MDTIDFQGLKTFLDTCLSPRGILVSSEEVPGVVVLRDAKGVLCYAMTVTDYEHLLSYDDGGSKSPTPVE